jgi:formate hydrogenlyase transcriptional activator
MDAKDGMMTGETEFTMSLESNAAGTPSDKLSARYEALIRLGEAIRSRPDPRHLFEALKTELREFVPFDAIAQFDGAVKRVYWHFEEPYQFLEQLARTIPMGQSIPSWVYEHQQMFVLDTRREDSRFPHLAAVGKAGIKSGIVLPLSTAHRRLGTLFLGSHIEDAYPPAEQQFLTLVANQIALAIDDATNLARLKLLLELTNRVVAKLELADLLGEISASIRELMQCEAVAIALADPETGELRVTALDSPNHPVSGSKPAHGFMKAVFESGRMVNLTRNEIAASGDIRAEIRSICSFPLISHERVLGVLTVASMQEMAFSEDDLCYLSQVATQIALAAENALAYGELSKLKERLARENVYLESEIRSELHFDEIVGTSPALKRVLREVETVAPTDSTVLIYGETGTGKELIARAVHNLSARKTHAFVKLNCAAIPTGLLESELFGNEKGAFTGAISQRIGRFELADRGTIFLDEIGEIALELQPKLLRVLQEREFERLGSSKTMRTDARLIAATNRDLKAMVDEQKFRSDLYYRLNVFPIRVPALRERSEDIPLLVRHFVQEFSRRNNRAIDTIPSTAMEALVRYPWPGNIRELQNILERAVIVTRGPVLAVPIAALKAEAKSQAAPRPAAAQQETLKDALNETERRRILSALEESNWIVAGPNGAAARLGVKRSTLQLRMQKLGIRISRIGSHGSR